MIITTEYSLPYFDFGKGDKDFILIPGSSMTSILEEAEGIKALFAPYTDDFHIYVFDVPTNLDLITSIGQFADIIADASSDLGIQKADVYGVSFGGMVAQELAIRHPGLVRSLTLASTMSRNNELSNEVISKWANTFNPEELAKELFSHVYSEQYYKKYEEAFHAIESNSTEEGVKRLHNINRIILEFSVYDKLDQIKCPVYVFAGSSDNTLGVEASIEIAEKLDCYIKIHENYSHAVYDEFPGFYDDVFANLK